MQELVSYRENLTKINRVVSFRGFVPDKAGEPHGPNSLSSLLSPLSSLSLLSPLSLPPPDKAELTQVSLEPVNSSIPKDLRGAEPQRERWRDGESG